MMDSSTRSDSNHLLGSSTFLSGLVSKQDLTLQLKVFEKWDVNQDGWLELGAQHCQVPDVFERDALCGSFRKKILETVPKK